MSIFNYNANARTLEGQHQTSNIQRVVFYSALVLFSVYTLWAMLNATYISFSVEGTQFDYSKIGWLIYLIGAMLIFIHPRYGIYLLVPFTLMGDLYLTWWWPFQLNFSSAQSMLFYSDAVIVSPLETYIIFTALSWLGRIFLSTKWRVSEQFFLGPLFPHLAVFLIFITFGVFYGVANGGDLTLALWESRPIFYLIVVAMMVGNVFEKREHLTTMMWLVMAGLFFEGIMGVRYFFVILHGTLAGVAGITEHAAAIHYNSVFIYFISIFLYKTSWIKRGLLLFMVPPIAFTFLATQRRSAFLALGFAIALTAIVLFKNHRKLFFIITPIVVVFGTAYTLAFWNSNSAIAFPAQAVRSMIDPNEEDEGSNVYRVLENVNSHFTISNKPLTGVGFGNKFLIIVSMADITFFEWWEYFTHNSIIWIWMKSGVGGFVSMIFLIGGSLMQGARNIWRMPNTEMGAVALTTTLYVFMHFLFAYVDISWGPQSMVYVGLAIGIINSQEHIVNKPVIQPEQRWYWLTPPPPAPELAPLPSELEPDTAEADAPKLGKAAFNHR